MTEITLVRRGEHPFFRVEFYESLTKFIGPDLPSYPDEHLSAAIAESEGAKSTLVLHEHIDSPMDFGDEHFIYELGFTAANVLALCSTDLKWSKEAIYVSTDLRPDAALLDEARRAVFDRIKSERVQLLLEFEQRRSGPSASQSSSATPPESIPRSGPEKKWWMFWK